MTGRLKLFLGYAPGVGKTNAMLEAALQRSLQGESVLVASAGQHIPGESAEMLAQFERVPLAAGGGLDVDGLLARRPDLVVVDDLHAANLPGARHPRRDQDVQELLDGGLNVFAALDVQHLESLIDDVYAITGYRENQTVPDEVMDKAAVIEVVDLPPEELLQRFRAGQVAAPELSLSAAEKFFRLGNLTALRELALRRAAGRVDAQMRAYMHSKDIPGPWAAGEHLMVCVSSHPLSERLVRAGRRLAGDLKADWVVVYVET
ncbi:sensor histidine kinase KdpD, partial [bacterium]